MSAWERLGWSAFGRPEALESLAPDEAAARVGGQHRGAYRLLVPEGEAVWECTAGVAGRLLHDAERDPRLLPVVGDWVQCRIPAGGMAVITRVLPRRTVLARDAPGALAGVQPLAANVERVLIVEGLDRGPNLRRLERVAAAAWGCGAEPWVVLTKADVVAAPAAAVAGAEAVVPGVPVLATSVLSGLGLEALRAAVPPGLTAVLVGPSGVGKSSLTNRLAGREAQEVGAVRQGDAKGRHTTVARTLLELPGAGLLIDMPGLREFGVGAGEVSVDSAYAEVAALAEDCRFRDCRHEREPGCAVQAAVEGGRLDAGRLEGFRKLARESAYHERREDPRAARAHERAVQRLHAAILRAKRDGAPRE